MRKRAWWLGRAVAVVIVGGLLLGGVASESAAQGDKKDD